MAYVLSPVFCGVPIIDANGNPISGGKIYTYLAGTTTPTTTWKDSGGVAAHTNPIILDSRGYVPDALWLNNLIGYKFTVTDAGDVPVGTPIDNVIGVLPGTVTVFPATANVSMGGFRMTNVGLASSPNDAMSRQASDNRYAMVTGTQDINMSGYVISNLGNPTDGTCAMSRNYADTRYSTARISVSTTITTNTTLGASYNGQFVVVDSAGAVTLTLDDTNPVNWICQILRKGAGTVTIQRQTTGTINGGTTGISIAAQWGIAQVVNYATGAASLVRWAA